MGACARPGNPTLYVANNRDDTLSAIAMRTCNATDRRSCHQRPPTSQLGEAPQALAADPATGTLYAANYDDNTVSIVAAAGCDATHSRGCRHEPATFATGSNPGGIAINRPTHTLYVANQGDNTVSVINTNTCNVRHSTGCRPAATVHVPGGPSDIAVDHANGTVYVSSYNNTVDVINAATCNALRTSSCGHHRRRVRVGAGPNTLDVDPATGTIYTGNFTGNSISVINANTCDAHTNRGCNQTPATLATGTQPIWLRVNPTTDTIYVSIFDGFSGTTVQVFNGATCSAHVQSGCGQTPASVTVGTVPWGIAINSKANVIYVAVNQNQGDGPGSIAVINGVSCDATHTAGCSHTPIEIPGVIHAPNGLMFDPATHTVYTGNNLGATLSVLNVSHPYAAHPDPLPRVAVGTSPYYAAVDHANHTIYVTNSGNGTVSILPEAPARSPSTANTVPALGHRHEASESRRPSRRPSDARDVSRGAR